MYAVRCKKHNCLYIGQTGDQLNNRMSKHRWDAKNRPDNNELATHFHKHDLDNDMEVWILHMVGSYRSLDLFITDHARNKGQLEGKQL